MCARNVFDLTKRERQILNLFYLGENIKSISKILNISNSTVATHRNNIFMKKNTKSMQQLLALRIKELEIELAKR